jgi:hypothetical protein
LHCHNCDWDQDDFWSESYNPVRSLRDWEKDLLNFDRLDESFIGEGFRTDDEDLMGRTRREVIAQELEKAAKQILNMVFLRPEDAKGQPCPKCGGFSLDID